MVDSRLILIEGLPGSGKTSTARYLHRFLSLKGFACSWFLEEDTHHPVTPRVLRRTAAVPGFAERCLKSWDGLVDAARSGDRVFILEGCAFQSTVRFMVENGRPHCEIADYVQKFEATVAPLSPRLILLYQDDPEEFMRDNVLPQRGPAWILKVSSHLASTPCCQQRGWEGADGMLRFWAYYFGICRDLCRQLRIPTLSIENSAQAWPAIHEQITSWVSAPRPESRVVWPAV